MNPITRKSMSKLVIQPSFRAVGQTHVEWQTFGKFENKRYIYGLGGLTAKHLSLICMAVRLGWTDYHTFVSYLYDGKAWVD